MSIKDSSNNSHQCWIIFEFPTKKLVFGGNLLFFTGLLISIRYVYLPTVAFTAA